MNLVVFLVPLVPVVWLYPVYILLLYVRPCKDLLCGKANWQFEFIDKTVFVFLVLCTLSFYNIDLVYRSPQNYLRYYLGTYLFPVLAYFAFRLTRFSDELSLKLCKTIMLSGLIFSCLCLFETISSHSLVIEFENPDQWIDGRIYRAGSLAGGSVHAGETMADFIAMTIPFMFIRYSGLRRLAMFVFLFLELAALVAIFSRAGYVAVFVCAIVGLYLLRGWCEWRFLVILSLFLLVLFGGSFLGLPEWLLERLTAADSTRNRLPRLEAGIYFMQDNISMGWYTALFGRGYISSYLKGGAYVPVEYASSEDGLSFLPGGFHNGYFTLIGDQGLLAFVCYVIILFIAFSKLWRYVRRVQLVKRHSFRNHAIILPVAWGLIVIVHLVTEIVHWESFFPQMFFFYMSLAMVVNLTKAERDNNWNWVEAGTQR